MIATPGVTEADERYLDEVRQDCEACLGRGARLLDLRREDTDSGVRLTVHYRLAGRERESAAVGESAVAAHAVLRARILFDRIRFGFAGLVDRA